MTANGADGIGHMTAARELGENPELERGVHARPHRSSPSNSASAWRRSPQSQP
jgi:hypothetical protein